MACHLDLTWVCRGGNVEYEVPLRLLLLELVKFIYVVR